MLTTTLKMLRDAQIGGYAIGAFNAENAEMVSAIVQAAEEMHSPVIIQTTPSTLKYLTPACFVGMVKAAAQTVSVPVALHLDHGASFSMAKDCIHSGYTSVMIDGSALPFEKNIQVTRQVVDYALNFGIPVEAELGKIGGKEDDVCAEQTAYTDPQDAQEFVKNTGVSSLAIAIGTAHGIYTSPPVLDLERITAIRQVLEIPLVLHGASGLSDEVMREAVKKGINKINFATELRMAYSQGIKQTIQDSPSAFDPKVYGRKGIEQVKELVKKKIQVCGSENRGIDGGDPF